MGSGYLLATIPLSEHIHTNFLKKMIYTILEIFFFFYTVGCMFVENWYISPYIVFICSNILVFLFIQKNGLLSRYADITYFKKIGRYILPVYLLQVAPLDIFKLLFDNYKTQFMEYRYLTIFITVLIVIVWGICVYHMTKKILSFMKC